MLTYKKLIIFAMLIIILTPILNSYAQKSKPMAYIYNGPESDTDTRYEFYIKLLKVVLDRTQKQFGPYTLNPAERMTEARQEAELAKNNGELTILVRGDNHDYRKTLRPLLIPLDKGILGYRVLLIRKEDQNKFNKINKLEDLKKVSIGQGLGWKDVNILEDNGLQVVTGASYDGLFGMLMGNRFDAFSRSVAEIKDEFNTNTKTYPNMAIEKHLLLNYPITRFYWFSKSSQANPLYKRVNEGLNILISDGTLDKFFLNYFAPKISTLNIKNRVLIQLKNKYASKEKELQNKKYWFEPSTFSH